MSTLRAGLNEKTCPLLGQHKVLIKQQPAVLADKAGHSRDVKWGRSIAAGFYGRPHRMPIAAQRKRNINRQPSYHFKGP
jgi:hypothetical protein